MALDTTLRGIGTGAGAEVNTTNQIQVITGLDAFSSPEQIGGSRIFSEVDPGFVTGQANLMSPEVDEDFRSRVSLDIFLDDETFDYTAQNTGKYSYANTTMTNAWTVGSMNTNSGSIVTTNTATSFGTYAYFSLIGTQTLAADIEASFSAAPVSNTTIDFGLFLRGAASPYAPTDGAYFRLTSAGLQGVVNYNGVETTTSVFLDEAGGSPWVYTPNKKYQFILYITPRAVVFWINDNGDVNVFGSINTPVGNGQPMAAASLPFSVRHAIGSAASGAISFQLARYNVRTGGGATATSPSTQGSRLFGSYQGLSGGTLGTLARYGAITSGNEANQTAAVPTTTTAALGSGLGGTFWETVSLAANTDAIIMSFQNPLGTVSVQGRRLIVRGISLSSFVQTVVVGGPYVAEWFLAFGHTAVSLATTESATTKAPRRITLPFVQIVTTAQAVTTAVAQNTTFCDFGDAPIFVNPGEFVQLCTRHIGTAGTTGTIVHQITVIYGWE